MIYILSLDHPLPGHSSALGVRAWQLFKLCQAKVGINQVKLLVSDSIHGKLPWEHIIRYKFPKWVNGYTEGFDFKNICEEGDTLIVPVNSYTYPIRIEYNVKLVIDCFAPIFSENVFKDYPGDVWDKHENNIKNLLSLSKTFLVGNSAQSNYWQGIFDSMGMEYYNIYDVPLYLPFDGKTRLKYNQESKLIICLYGSYTPWLDCENTFELIKKFPKDYSFLFKGIMHPTFKRQDLSLGMNVINEYIKAMPKGVRNRIVIDQTWDSTVIKCKAMIYITKMRECRVAYKVRAAEAIGNKVPLILAPQDNIYNIFAGYPEYSLINNYKEDIKDILHYINNRSSTEACTTSYTFADVMLNNMGWLK